MAIDTSIRIRLIDGFSAGLLRMRSGLGTLSSSLGDLSRSTQFAANMNQAAEGVERFGAMARTAIEVPTQAFIGFEQAMSRVAALSGEVATPAFAAMSAQAQELGAATSFSAAEAALAMGNFAQAGMRANEILSLTPPTMALARAAAAGLDQTSEILGSTLNSMGIDASQAGMAADVLTRAFTSSNTTLASLGESFKVAAPLARQTGTDIQTLAAMVAVLGNNAIQGSEAGTGLRTAMASLASPAGAGAEALGDLGFAGERLVQLQELVANGRMPEALAAIGRSMSALTEDQKLAALMNIFGREGVTSGAILINAAMDTSDRGLAGYARALRDVDGAAASVSATMEDNLGGEFERLSGALDGLYISLGQRFAPGLRDMAIDLQGTVDRMNGWASENSTLVSGMGTALTATVGLAAGVRGMMLVSSAATSTVAGLRVGLTAALSPMGLVGTAVAGIAYAAYQLVEAERRLRDIQRARARAQATGNMELRQQEEQTQRVRLRAAMDRRSAELLRDRPADWKAEMDAIERRRAMLDREEEVADQRNRDERRLLEINQSGQENTAAGRRERTEIQQRLDRAHDYVNGTVGFATAEQAAAAGAFGVAGLGQNAASVFGGRRRALSEGADQAEQDLESTADLRRRREARQRDTRSRVAGAAASGDLGAVQAVLEIGSQQAIADSAESQRRLTEAVQAMTRALDRAARAPGGGTPTGPTA